MTANAQTYAPVVTMTITAPDGTTHDVAAQDSTVGTMKLKDGSEYQFRPTVMDEPFNKVIVGILELAGRTHPQFASCRCVTMDVSISDATLAT